MPGVRRWWHELLCRWFGHVRWRVEGHGKIAWDPHIHYSGNATGYICQRCGRITLFRMGVQS